MFAGILRIIGDECHLTMVNNKKEIGSHFDKLAVLLKISIPDIKTIL
jgi:hypothetical protein